MLDRGPVARMLATGGQLRWRVLMIVVLLASIAFPLRRALLQVANETLTRAIIQEDMKRLAPSDGVVSRQVSVDKNDIVIRVISTRPIADSKITEVRQDLMRRTGHFVQISVEAVASQSAIAALMERLQQPVPAPPPEPKAQSVAEMQQQLLKAVSPAVEAAWPSFAAPLQDFNVVVGGAGLAVNVRYQAPKDLGDVPLQMVAQNLRAKLGVPDLALHAVRVPPSTREPSRPTAKRGPRTAAVK